MKIKNFILPLLVISFSLLLCGGGSNFKQTGDTAKASDKDNSEL